MQPLQDKVVVITGASRGVGAATARQFAAEGARVVLTARTRKTLEDTAATLGTDKKRYLVVTADITKPAGMAKIVDAAVKAFGRIDLFVNNAGIGVRKPIEQTGEDDFDLTFGTNVKAVFRSFQEVLPVMRKQGEGHIINISSMASKEGRPTLAVYCASKAALNVMSQAVGAEVRNENIKVSVLMPGSINTNFLSRVSRDTNPSPKSKPRLTPDEVAEKIVFMAKQNHGVWASLAEMRPLHTL